MKVFSVRLPDDVASELDSLVQLLGISKNELVQILIRQEYSKYGQDPKIQKMLTQMNELKTLLDKFSIENA